MLGLVILTGSTKGFEDSLLNWKYRLYRVFPGLVAFTKAGWSSVSMGFAS